jgi:hypothetical protein
LLNPTPYFRSTYPNYGKIDLSEVLQVDRKWL